ncbi:tRNA pseudouridine(38-40) synthase TruA [Maribacter sp. 2307ULW6-5]|uniref:tRNA pseudouridine(38-40) synthase TruA n=1 Tax=Maribacter sp. 2307ULW6-5 TaxID=3386275 RepID=UPI0039BD154B
MRYFIRFSYFGTAYHGWQRQPNAPTVQAVLEDALSKLLGAPTEVVAAGRTDAGVHAEAMYAHLDVPEALDTGLLVPRLNAFLPMDIAVAQILPVRPQAHARFDAVARSYRYQIVQVKDPFSMNGAHYVKRPLDVAAMNQAAEHLLGRQDFKCFSKSNTDVKTFFCDVSKAEWTVNGNACTFEITADRFLRNMVRAVVGTLLQVGLHQHAPAHVKTVIKSGNRSQAGPSVPAKGLYLAAITYPKSIFLDG